MQRFTRDRTTDPPTLRLAVTPRRGRSPASSRPRRGPRLTSTRKCCVVRRSPTRERRSKSRRLRRRSRRENRRSPAKSATGLLGGDRDDQALPTLGASALQDCPAVLRRHARPEAVAATALQPARLIRSLHGDVPLRRSQRPSPMERRADRGGARREDGRYPTAAAVQPAHRGKIPLERGRRGRRRIVARQADSSGTSVGWGSFVASKRPSTISII